MTTKKWFSKNTKCLCGKRIAVTGSTGGLGKELCAYVASLGGSLILLDRNAEKSQAHKAELEKRFGAEVKFVFLDLEELDSAKNACEVLISEKIDVFVHNAGAYSIPRHKCKSGYDNIFQINFATPYYMICKILPMLRENNGRVVAVGSIAHNYSVTDKNDVDFSSRKADSKVYGNAKRYLMFALHRLFETEKSVSLAIVHPGITFTNITAHYPKLVFAVIKHPMKIIFMKPKKAVLSVLKGIFDPTEYCTWTGPGIFGIWGLPKKKALRTCKREEQDSIFVSARAVFQRCCDCAERKTD